MASPVPACCLHSITISAIFLVLEWYGTGMFRQVNSIKFSVIYHYVYSVCEVYRDGGYVLVDEDCARESMAKARSR